MILGIPSQPMNVELASQPYAMAAVPASWFLQHSAPNLGAALRHQPQFLLL